MQIKATLIAAALSVTVMSEFAIVTRPSLNIDLSNLQSQRNSLSSEVSARIASLTASLPASDISRAASAHTALANFVATAPSSLSVPTDITKIGGLTTFSATPGWYSALPSDLKSYYDGSNAKVQSVINEVLGQSTSVGGSATGANAPKSTGGASQEKVVQYIGVAGAAVMVGVFAL